MGKLDRAVVRIFGLSDVVLQKQKDVNLPLAIPATSHGSGLIISADGLILTARHVVVGSPMITVAVPGDDKQFNQTLEKALRVADFLELGELMARDALERKESCGGHFREESQTEEGEAKRDDENFAHVAGWEYQGEDKQPIRNTEPLTFERVPLMQRSYK
jgi:hypothetical protein